MRGEENKMGVINVHTDMMRRIKEMLVSFFSINYPLGYPHDRIKMSVNYALLGLL
jgi:hypothetical protein